MVPPGVKVPQFTELREVVHALSEYTPKFADVDTVPTEDTDVDVEMAEKVVSAKANPIMTNATTAIVIESFRFAVIPPPQIPYKVSSAWTYSTMQFSRATHFTFCLNKFLCDLINIAKHPAIQSKNTKTRISLFQFHIFYNCWFCELPEVYGVQHVP
jgi:hypothetical protein